MPEDPDPKRLTIDERLEALARSVEIMQRDYEHRFSPITRNSEG